MTPIFNWLLRMALSRADYPAVAGDLAEEYRHHVRPTRTWIRAQTWYAGQVVSVMWFSLVDRIRPVRSALPVSEYPADRGGALGVMSDVAFALRLFRREPGLFAATIAGLAIAIGVSAAVFSLVRAVEYRTLGVAARESVVQMALSGIPSSTKMTGNSPFSGNWPHSAYVRLRDASTTVDTVASSKSVSGLAFSATSSNSESPYFEISAVSANYFSVLGLRMSLGRSFTTIDDAPDVANTVISYGFWKNRLGADPAVLGRTVWLGGHPFTVVGIADRSVSGTIETQPPALWITLAAERNAWTRRAAAQRSIAQAKLGALQQTGSTASDRERLKALEPDLAAAPTPWNPAVEVLGRLKPGITLARAEAEAGVIVAGTSWTDTTVRAPTVRLTPLDTDDEAPGRATIFTVLMAIVGAVVLIACANVTNLLLANAAGRRREIGTRLALGASRGRIVRQLLTESLLIGAIGGAAGLWIAIAVGPSFAALVNVPPQFDVSPDPMAYLFVAVLTVAVGTLAGLAPARYGRRGDLASALATDRLSLSSAMPPTRMRSILIGGQAAGAIVFIVVASLMARSLIQSLTLDLGFDPDRVMTTTIGNGSNGKAWDETRKRAYWHLSLDYVRELPGIAGVSLATLPPFGGTSYPRLPNGRTVDPNETSSEYFVTMGLSVIQGRTYTDDEVRRGAPVAVISESLAREVWNNDNPIGASLDRALGEVDRRRPGPWRRSPDTRVIGVVTDLTTRLRTPRAPTIYFPLNESSVPSLVIRSQTDPRGLERAVHAALDRIDPGIEPRTLFAADRMTRELEGPRTLAVLAGLVATNALGLAIMGLFGVTAFVVRHRTREISIRRALGATEAEVVRMLFRESLRPVAIGLLCGLVIALIGGKAIEGLLFGISGRDPLAIAGAVVVLLAAAAAAVLVPARRAARVNPAELLKQG
jgi:predicted permease